MVAMTHRNRGGVPASSLRRLKERTSVRHQVFEQMKQQIAGGHWAPGTKIPSEAELSRIFGVSRISVREALQKMVALDLLETRHGEGTFVRRLADHRMSTLIPEMLLTRHDILDVLEYRGIVEAGIVGLVVNRATAADLAELEVLLQRMRKAKDDIPEFAFQDLEFHLALARMTRNPVILKITAVIKDLFTSSMVDIVGELGVNLGLHYHAAILAAIKARDKARAQKLMTEHVASTVRGMDSRRR